MNDTDNGEDMRVCDHRCAHVNSFCFFVNLPIISFGRNLLAHVR